MSAGAWWFARARPEPAQSLPIPGENGPALAVEVLNATEVDGLAREIARRLRRQAIDVVYFGSHHRSLDSTRILVRRGDSLTALPVRRALGLGLISVDLDPHRLLEVTVLVGRDLAPRARSHP